MCPYSDESWTSSNAPLPRIPGFNHRVGIESVEIDADRLLLALPPEEDDGIVGDEQMLDGGVGRFAGGAIVAIERAGLRSVHLRAAVASVVVAVRWFVLAGELR